MDILLAIDDDPVRDQAIRAVQHWLPDDARVVALHVGDRSLDPTENTASIAGGGLVGLPYLTMPDLASDDLVDRQARQIAVQAAGAVDGETRVEGGDVADTIVRVAGQMRADLIVVGTGDRSWLSRLVDSSVGSEVAATAPCSVLVVRTTADGPARGETP